MKKKKVFVSNIPTSVNLTLSEKFKEYGKIIGIDFFKGSKGTEDFTYNH